MRRLRFFLARVTLRSLRVGPLAVLFIIGHMRCGSTLRLHILLTNSKFIGCGERNVAYRSAVDLDKLEIAARIAQPAPFRRAAYAVDQINHDHLTPNPALLRDERVRCIFLIRDPRPTIESIVNLTQTFYEPWSVERAVEVQLAATRDTLSIRRKLGTLPPSSVGADLQRTRRRHAGDAAATGIVPRIGAELRGQYAIQTFTGKRGDPSENIRAGRIVRSRVAPSVEIPDREFDRAFLAYHHCARTLQLTSRR